jgi:predicted amidohydrolase YtcJ
MTQPGASHTADLIVVNGNVATVGQAPGTPPRAQAVAIRAGRVLAVGSNEEMREHRGSATREIDVEGRTVIPGLNDSHLHMIRAGQTWDGEVRWEEVDELESGLRMLRDDAMRRGPGGWVRVVGGWHPGQFAERRTPTRDDLDEYVPDNPVYLQYRYNWALLNSVGMRAVGLTRETPDPPGGSFERDERGEPTGYARGFPAFGWINERMPSFTLEEQVASTRTESLAFNRHGITGITDGGGYGCRPETYRAVYELNRRGGLTTRVRITVHASKRGLEPDEMNGYVRFAQPRFGDDMLQLLGAGEVVCWGTWDRSTHPLEITPDALDDLTYLSRLFAASGWPVQIHTNRLETISTVLDVWEAVNREHPIAPLRWALVHAEPIDERNIRRVKALGVGLLIQSKFHFYGREVVDAWGEEKVAQSPPFRTILDAGIPLGAGTDSHRAMTYLPFTSLQWYITGLTAEGDRFRAPEHLLSREEALYLYTVGSAWFSFEEHTRGSLDPGKLADLAVLTDDYFSVPEEQIPDIRSVLTIVGGRRVYAAGPFEGLQEG